MNKLRLILPHALFLLALIAGLAAPLGSKASAQARATPDLPDRRDGVKPEPSAAPAAAPPAKPAPTPKPNNVRLTAVLSPGGLAVTSGLSWRLERARQPQAASAKEAPAVWSGPGAEAALRLAEGDYIVKVRYGLAEATYALKVQAGQTVNEAVPLNAGLIAARALNVPGGTVLSPAFFTVSTAGAGERREIGRSSAEPATFHLNDGRYLLRAEAGLASLETEVDVQAGKVTAVDVALNVGSLELKAFAAAGDPKLLPATHNIYAADDPARERGRPLLRITGATHRVELPAGSYRIETLAGLARQESVVAIKPGQITSQGVVLNAGELKVEPAIEPGAEPETCAVYTVGTFRVSQDPIARASGPSPSFILPAGSYRLTCQPAGQAKPLRNWSGDIGAGQTVEVSPQRS